MKFKDFNKKFTNEVYDSSLNPQKTETVEQRNVAVWMVYQTIETNKKLVRATWILAIATIILSGLTIYLQYFK
jgi:hypothetical protein